MNTEDFLKTVHENNIMMYMNGATGFPVLNDNGEIIPDAQSKSAHASMDALHYSDDKRQSVIGIRLLNKIAKQVLDEEDCTCGLNFGQTEQIKNKILAKVSKPN